MDLIYADENRNDIDILREYELDIAYGKDENDFLIKRAATEDVYIGEDYILYIEGTEYGGIVDEVHPDTSDNTIAYKGRTWHGVLDGNVLCPDKGQDYLLLNGEANEVLLFLVKRMGLTDIFEVSTNDSGIDIVNYQVRYEKCYQTMRKMLFQFDAKLTIRYTKGKVVLEAVPNIDYSQDEEWDSTQLNFKIEKKYNVLNHLVCLGSGDMRNRHVIHLFCDENGGVRPYLKNPNISPIQDSDYILDESQKQCSGIYHISEKLDYPNAETKENYTLLSVKPSNWDRVYSNYYQRSGDSYSVLQSYVEDVYTLQILQPYDWAANYRDYYINVDGEWKKVEDYSEVIYVLQSSQPSDWLTNYGTYYDSDNNTVQAITQESYVLQLDQPADWATNYNNYFVYYSDGVTGGYNNVAGVSKNKYTVQTSKPTDWSSNYKNYYKKKKSGGYTAVTATSQKKAPAWKAKKYYTKSTYYVAPAWKAKKYYTHYVTPVAPTWVKDTYYTKTLKSVPDWNYNTYYTKSERTILPQWAPNAYYKRTEDHFADLVEKGLKKIQEAYDCDKIDISLDDTQTYDIGDIVGAREESTGIYTWQPITKKIITINDNVESIDYEIGE